MILIAVGAGTNDANEGSKSSSSSFEFEFELTRTRTRRGLKLDANRRDGTGYVTDQVAYLTHSALGNATHLVLRPCGLLAALISERIVDANAYTLLTGLIKHVQ